MPETSDREKENLLRKRGLLAGMLVIKDGELVFVDAGRPHHNRQVLLAPKNSMIRAFTSSAFS